jgi:hypothetical protein
MGYGDVIMQGVHLAASGSNFIGAEADINVWNPKVDLPDDSTTAQIWLKAGNGNEFESIEAGWMVSVFFVVSQIVIYRENSDFRP